MIIRSVTDFQNALSGALDRFEEDAPRRELAHKKSLRLDLWVLLAYVFAFGAVLPDYLYNRAPQSGADWALRLHASMLVLASFVLHLQVRRLNRKDKKDIPALEALLERAEDICAGCRRGIRAGQIIPTPAERERLQTLACSLQLARGAQLQIRAQSAGHRRACLAGSLLLLILNYASLLIPCMAEGWPWTWVDWAFGLLMTTIATAFLGGELIMLFAGEETQQLRKQLGRCKTAIRNAAQAEEEGPESDA